VGDTLTVLPAGLDFVFYTAAADSREDGAYHRAYVAGPENLLAALQSQDQTPRRVFFTSSTAVFGQNGGEWVDEESPTEPGEFSGRRLLEGESLFLKGPFPATVLRLAGIYGPGRTRLIDQVRRGEARCWKGAPHFTNRIHRDDCAGALRHLMALTTPQALYLGVDTKPVSRREVLTWIAAGLGLPEPPWVPPPAGGGRSNKRCSSARLLASGYRLAYPSYREGYGEMLRSLGAFAAAGSSFQEST